MHIHADMHSFELVACGHDMRALPDIPLVARPVMDTSLHKFAGPFDDHKGVWVLRARHTGDWKTKRRPRVTLQREGADRHLAISFKLPSQELIRSKEALFAALEKSDYRLSCVNLPLASVYKEPPPVDELTTLQRFNAVRLEKIRAALNDAAPPMSKHNQWASTEAKMNEVLGRFKTNNEEPANELANRFTYYFSPSPDSRRVY